MNDWKEIRSDRDINDLLKIFGRFHDGCIREVYLTTKQQVNDDLSMSFDHVQQATILFQRQFKNPSAIELKFVGLLRFNFNPPCDGIIYDCTLKIVDDIFYWADEPDWALEDNSITWVSSKKLFWRESQL